jgi:hypothetical protein
MTHVVASLYPPVDPIAWTTNNNRLRLTVPEQITPFSNSTLARNAKLLGLQMSIAFYPALTCDMHTRPTQATIPDPAS